VVALSLHFSGNIDVPMVAEISGPNNVSYLRYNPQTRDGSRRGEQRKNDNCQALEPLRRLPTGFGGKQVYNLERSNISHKILPKDTNAIYNECGTPDACCQRTRSVVDLGKSVIRKMYTFYYYKRKTRLWRRNRFVEWDDGELRCDMTAM